MHFSLFDTDDAQPVIALFTRVFSASEGENEGKVVGELVSKLIQTSKTEELFGYVLENESEIQACIFFSRFYVPSGETAFILSPVAVATEAQGKGLGKQLIRFGLQQLNTKNVSLVFTYGDPAFYSKVGFQPVENRIQAPYPLSQPIGWLAQKLDGTPISAMQGATRCVAALSCPEYW